MVRRNATILRIFIASPSDVADERAVVEQVIAELNQVWSRTLGIYLDLVRWETHAYPEVGVDAQEVINRELHDDYDIFVGVMWARFGTPTARAGSGTEEEYERAYARHVGDPSSTRIMFYFKTAALSPSAIDAIQLGKVQTFRTTLGSRGTLYWDFSGSEEFAQLLRMHLSRTVQAYGSEWGIATPALVVKQLSDSSVVPAARDEDDAGFFELIDEGTHGIETVTNALERMSESLRDFNVRINERKATIQSLSEDTTTDGTAKTKRISGWMAEDLDHLATRLAADLPLLSPDYVRGIDAYSRAFSYLPDFGEAEKEAARDSLQHVRGFRTVMEQGLDTTISYRETVASIPRMTTALNRAKKRVLAVLDDLSQDISGVVNLTRELEKTIEEYTAGADAV